MAGGALVAPPFPRHQSPTGDFLTLAAAVNGRPRAERGHKGRPRRWHRQRSPGASRIPQRPFTADDGVTAAEEEERPPADGVEIVALLGYADHFGASPRVDESAATP
jgi:hypothetical protein